VSDKSAWLRNHALLTPTQISEVDAAYRSRAQAVEAVDDLIAKLEQRLRRDGVAGNTTSSSAPTTGCTSVSTG
jgi:hypothetical protein